MKLEKSHIPISKTPYRARVGSFDKTVWCWPKDRHRDQGDRIDSLELNIHN